MTMAVYGLIGRTLGHSWSVPIHRELGCDGYKLIELEPEELAGFFAEEDIGGLNVTIPYKLEVKRFCGSLADSARRVGSVNTIVKDASGALVGHNTDLCGLLYAMESAGISMKGRKVLIFGSGGASLSAQAAADIQGAREAVVISRSGPDNYRNLSRHADAEILVNATPLGMYPRTGAMAADPAFFQKCVGVVDMIYNPRRTAFLLRAEELGIPCTDGLPMLVAQAAAAEELFTGREGACGEIPRIVAMLRRQMMNIVLIGMPGCGKSSTGRELAALTGRPLVDIDEEIVKSQGRSIEEIFASDGEAEFRRLEREHTAAAGRESGKILVTGGGVVKDFEGNYPSLHQNGRICHLERDVLLLNREGRPLSRNADLDAMYAERLPLYRKFRDAEVANTGPLREVAEAVWRDFCENIGD